MTESWRETTLGSVCDEVSGTIQTGPFGSQLHESDYSREGIPVVMPKDIVANRIATAGIARVRQDHVERLGKHKLQAGDIVYGRRGDIGRQALVRPDQVGWLCGTGCLRIGLGDSVIEPMFLHYYLQQQSLITWIANQAIGATMPNLNTGILRRVPVRFPSLSTQRKIAAILAAYDKLIDNNTRRIKILEQTARALYREWFVKFHFPGHDRLTRVASPVGDIPYDWEAIPFETLLASMTGGDWGSEQPTDAESAAVCIVRGTDFDEVTYGSELRAPVRYIRPSSLVSRGLRPGDVIVENSINAKSRCIGTTLLVDTNVLARVGRDAVAASFCKVFRLHDPQLSSLVHLHFRRLREDARMEYYQNVAANGIGNFQAQRFVREEYLVVPRDEVLRSELVGVIASMFESVSVFSSQMANLRRTRDILLPRLMQETISVGAVESAA